jgi:hypothetical protein
MQRLISTHVEASKIGRQIAEEVLDSQRRGGDSSSESSPSPDTEKALPSQITQPSAEVLADQFIKRQMYCIPTSFLPFSCKLLLCLIFLVINIRNYSLLFCRVWSIMKKARWDQI